MKVTQLLAATVVVAATLQVHAQGMSMKPASAASGSVMPLVDAEVRKVDLDKGLVVLRHGDIPNIAIR